MVVGYLIRDYITKDHDFCLVGPLGLCSSHLFTLKQHAAML